MGLKPSTKKKQKTKTPYTDFNQIVYTYIFSKCQEMWNSCLNELFGIKLWRMTFRLQESKKRKGSYRQTSHWYYLYYLYILKNEEHPMYISCMKKYLVIQILIEYIAFKLVCERYYRTIKLKELF